MFSPQHFQPATGQPSRLPRQEKALSRQNAGAGRWTGEQQHTERHGQGHVGRTLPFCYGCASYSAQPGKAGLEGDTFICFRRPAGALLRIGEFPSPRLDSCRLTTPALSSSS